MTTFDGFCIGFDKFGWVLIKSGVVLEIGFWGFVKIGKMVVENV